MVKAMQGGACFCLQFFSRRQLFSFLENILNYIIITTTALWLHLVVYSVVYMLLVFSFHFFFFRAVCAPSPLWAPLCAVQ
jgi:hypothetical protein